MIEKAGKYPAYVNENEKLKSHKALVSLDYEQILEIACVFYYVNVVLAKIPRWLGGIRLTERARALHKSIHDAAVNCCMSLEEADRYEREGGKSV